MKINSVRIFLNNNADSNLKATVTVVVNGALILQSIRIMEDRNIPDKLNVMYPIRKLERGRTRRCFYPSTEESLKYFNETIMDAYEKVVKNPEVNSIDYELGEQDKGFTITMATVYPDINPETPLRAKVNLELDGELMLRSMNLVARDDGALWLRMPRRKLQDGGQMDIYHPLTKEVRDALTHAVMPYYEQAVKEAKKASLRM